MLRGNYLLVLLQRIDGIVSLKKRIMHNSFFLIILEHFVQVVLRVWGYEEVALPSIVEPRLFLSPDNTKLN